MYVCMNIIVCVCMYVWMDGWMYVCMYGWMDGCMYGWMYVCMCNMNMNIQIQMYTHNWNKFCILESGSLFRSDSKAPDQTSSIKLAGGCDQSDPIL